MYKMVVEALDRPLVMREAADLVAEPGQLVIDVKSVGCNFFDILISRGQYQVKPELPFSPGAEIAGVVSSVGKGVSGYAEGDRVMAMLDYGGYASQVTINAMQAFKIPAEMSFDTAAALGIVYQTSYFALVHRIKLNKGETLLVHAAAGGVGLAAVQIGVALGATVIGTAGSQAKLDLVAEQGAAHTINYREEPWLERVQEIVGKKGVDVIYDPVGGEIFDLSTKCIAFEGRLLVIGFAGGTVPTMAMNRVLLKNISIVGLHWGMYIKRNPLLVVQTQQALFDLVTEGKINPVVSKTYPLTDAVEALEALGSRKTAGKLILRP